MSCEATTHASSEAENTGMITEISISSENAENAMLALQKRAPLRAFSDSTIPQCQRARGSASPTATLMSLPSEIRSRILQFLLCHHKPLDNAYVGRVIDTFGLTPSVLRANRLLYAEGKAVLYGENTMRIRVNINGRAWNTHEVRVTMPDHAGASFYRRMIIEDRQPNCCPPPKLFRQFHIYVKLGHGFHKLRVKQTLQELVMNLNHEWPIDKPRKLTLMYEEDPDSVCARCHVQLNVCEVYNDCPNSPHVGCSGPTERRQTAARNAVKFLAPFRFLKNVSNVAITCAYAQHNKLTAFHVKSADNLIAQITNSDKGPDLFPLYWALVCYLQRIPDDPYTSEKGLEWEKKCSPDLEKECNRPEGLREEGLAENSDDSNEFAFGPETTHWRCPVWLRNRTRSLRWAMDKGDEELFRWSRTETRNFISIVLDDVRDDLIYMFEGGRPPSEEEDTSIPPDPGCDGFEN